MLRAIRVYFVPRWAKGEDSMKIVFHDEHGTRIHAHLSRKEKEKFENQISEGGVYAIRNVFVHDNYQRLKSAANDKLLGTVTVSTTFHVTKMLFDGNSAEVNEFRARTPLRYEIRPFGTTNSRGLSFSRETRK
ncbi:unnamed protein product [Cuscuta campestris]|uniref:Replication protein A 70 kDa DNA-binding subunit B/D first OB fold domain-containing protein n=1 Tax=Cuscuta campestris TaxID=132261 RepID=A0A484M555_9ASTE|nr:unnamed protein product [Cuscuta campestris]